MLQEFRIRINKLPDEVFQFLCHKDSHVQEKGSPVLLLEKTTDGPIGIGTCYREVVQMAPFLQSQILSEVTRFEPDSVLEEKWSGGGMKGILTYFFHPVDQGTDLVQKVNIETKWFLKAFTSVISNMYAKAASYRLDCIKTILETGQSPDIQKIKWWKFNGK